MKACILSIVDLSRMTLASLYTDYFEREKIEYDYIFVDKTKKLRKTDNMIPLHVDCHQNSSFPRKVIAYWKLRHIVKNILLENNYDLIVVWNEVSTFFFADILKKYFSGRYTINIRDYYKYLNYPIVKQRMSGCIGDSYMSTVSSDAYIKYLPENEYFFVHSLNRKILNGLKPHTVIKNKSTPIEILYIGQIGWLENLYKFVDAFINDSRFIVKIIGVGSEKIDEYLNGKNAGNIQTFGRFAPERTAEYLSDADVIYNLYGYDNPHVNLALSIKLYYAIYLHLPILTYSGTHMNDIASECGIAITVNGIDAIPALPNKLKTFYDNFDFQKASEKCDSYIANNIERNHSAFINKLKAYRES